MRETELRRELSGSDLFHPDKEVRRSYAISIFPKKEGVSFQAGKKFDHLVVPKNNQEEPKGVREKNFILYMGKPPLSLRELMLKIPSICGLYKIHLNPRREHVDAVLRILFQQEKLFEQLGVNIKWLYDWNVKPRKGIAQELVHVPTIVMYPGVGKEAAQAVLDTVIDSFSGEQHSVFAGEHPTRFSDPKTALVSVAQTGSHLKWEYLKAMKTRLCAQLFDRGDARFPRTGIECYYPQDGPFEKNADGIPFVDLLTEREIREAIEKEGVYDPDMQYLQGDFRL